MTEVIVCVARLTFASFALLVAVDQQVARALGAEGQQDALQHSWQQSEAQQQRPKGGVAHDGFYTKDLQTAKKKLLQVLLRILWSLNCEV